MQVEDSDDRVSERQAVLLQARCRKSSWHVFPVELGDISHGGCSIVGSSEAFALGETIRLNIANMKPIEAHVRWLLDDKVGVEFTAALKGRVMDDLRAIYGIGGSPTSV